MLLLFRSASGTAIGPFSCNRAGLSLVLMVGRGALAHSSTGICGGGAAVASGGGGSGGGGGGDGCVVIALKDRLVFGKLYEPILGDSVSQGVWACHVKVTQCEE